MRTGLLLLFLTSLPSRAQSSVTPPIAPTPATVDLQLFSSSKDVASTVPTSQLPGQSSLTDSTVSAVRLTRSEAETISLKNNPRITASQLLGLAAGQITRQTRSAELPQIYGAITAEKAEDGSRIGAGSLTDSRLYTHAGTGGNFSQLITDFGHTRELVATNKLQQRAQDRTTVATATYAISHGRTASSQSHCDGAAHPNAS